MKKQYLKHLPRFKKQTVQCQKSFHQPISQTFERIKNEYNLLDCIKLQNLLQTLKQVKPLQDEMKRQIFSYFLQKQLKDFQFIKSRSKIVLRILRLTKVKLPNYKLNWLYVWNRILKEFQQIPRKQFSNMIQFLKIIRIFYDQNNALQVFQYFIKHYGSSSQYVFSLIFNFTNITDKTDQKIFQKFLQQIVQSYRHGHVKPKSLIIYFINLMKKRQTNDLPDQKYKIMNNIILAVLITPPSKDIKNSIQSKFTKQHSIMISQFIGKHNPHSVSTLRMLFDIVDKFINPFQNSTKTVRFLFSLIRFIWKRKQRERKAQLRLDKILQKQKKQIQKQQIYLKQLSKQSIDINQQTLAEQLQIPDQIGKNQQLHEDDQQNQQDLQSDQQKDKQQGLQQQLNQGQQQTLSNQIQQKKKKCLRILKNQITDQIIDEVKNGIRKIFNYVYFVNSKKTVPQFIRYSFIMMPQLIIKSLDLLDKASQIPYINEQGLVANIKITVQYMFSPLIIKQSLQNLRRILDRIINCSKIVQVWPIYQLLCSKFPLLDEKDLQKVPQQDKQLFFKKYQLNHDRFYQYYSENVFEAFKRMIRQGQYFDQNTVKQNTMCFQQLLYNSYPYYKRLLLNQILEQITQNRKNQFVYNFFNPSFKLTSQTQQIIQQQLNIINQNQSEQTIELRNNLVMILCYNLPLQKLKKYIRQFASKNYYRVIPIYYENRAAFHLQIEPVDTSLRYYDQNTKMKFKTTKPIDQRQQAIEQLYRYCQQLIQQLHSIVLKSSSSTNIAVNQQQIKKDYKNNQQISTIISSLYKLPNQNDPSAAKLKLQNVGTRKKIAQILKLIYSIVSHLSHKIIQFDNQILKYQSINPLRKRQSLFKSVKFLQIFYTLLTNPSYLHDIKLTGIFSQLITHQLVYNYGNQSRQNKDKINKNILLNSYQQLPQFCNRFIFMQTFSQKIKLLHNSTLLNQIKKQRTQWISNNFNTNINNKNHNLNSQNTQFNNQQDNQQNIKQNNQNSNEQPKQISQDLFQKIINELKILIAAPGNEKSSCLIKSLLITNGMKGIPQFLLNLYSQTHIQSRFYWQKVNQIFDQFKNYGLRFTIQQLIQIIDYHGKILTQNQNKKIKQIILKSFKNIITIIKQNNQNYNQYNQELINIQKIQIILRKYRQHQKLKLVWLLSLNIVLTTRKYINFQNDSIKNKMNKMQTVWQFMKMLQPMILSDTRIIRRLSLFIYSLCFRKIKKLLRTYQIQKINQIQYKTKSINQLIQTGYLRKQHINQNKRKINSQDGTIIFIKRIQKLQKTAPYQQFQVSVIDKNSQLYKLYSKIQQQSFQFIMSNQQNAFRFINNFHTDMVSTAQQLISMSSNIQKPTQLSQVVIKQLQQSFYFFVPKKLNFDRIQLYFGQRFFKYLMAKDSRNGFRLLFNHKVQQLIQKSLTNLQSLDNQALIFILAQEFLAGYQRNFNQMSQQIRLKIQKFISDIYFQTAKKASGNIFKRWGIIFKKIQNEKSLQFLLSFMKKQIQQKKRVSRNGLIYLTIRQNNLQDHFDIAKILLQNKIQLENTILNKIINTIMTLPQKYPINKDQAIKYKFIDFYHQLQNETIQKSTQRTYYIKNVQFKNYLIKILRSYVQVVSQQKSQNQSNIITQFYKNAYSLILNAINCFCHCFQSQFNMVKIKQLVQLIQIMTVNKQQTQVIDYKQFQPILKVMFGYQYQDVQNYQIVLKSILRLIKVLPSKRQAQILTIIMHRPYNIILFSQQKYQQILLQIFTLQQSTTNYKQLMVNISVLLSFRMVKMQKFLNQIAKKFQIGEFDQSKSIDKKIKILIHNAKSKRKVILLYQCQQLATLKLNKQTINMILSQSTKQRRNIFCRQLLSLRGKKQYLDDQQTYHIWKKIKQNSNPYNYIV